MTALTPWQQALLASIPETENFHTLRRDVKKRVYLFYMQKGKCFWCGKPMVIHFCDGGHQPPDSATLEHLDSRYSSDRGAFPLTRRIVAAHWRCNMDRARAETSALPIEELHRRSRGMA